MKKKSILFQWIYPTVFVLLAAFFLQTCGTVPITGRRQLLLVSDQEVLGLSETQYKDFITTASIEKNTTNAALVEKVGKRIASAVETYLRSNGLESEIQSLAWEFNLVNSSEVNAFCMPGGKIVVYTGILPITQDESGLATVLGHEVAHAIAKHSNERMSQQVAVQYGGEIAGGLLGNSTKAQQLGNAVFGLGAQYGIMLPYARTQELEADKLGLIFMSMAGYDPNTAVSFWQRMAQSSSGGTPEFMSTHPSDANRIEKIKAALPEALQYYKGAGVQNSGTVSSSLKSSVAKTSEEWKF
ncbi:MAG: M48 family metallopeptidase [Dysgonamonadaceae bacterium]|jgi:predicted Zn-dependent protease|nr:M48 family metallopeptidase [Dysgonamonadaceae bacterium]